MIKVAFDPEFKRIFRAFVSSVGSADDLPDDFVSFHAVGAVLALNTGETRLPRNPAGGSHDLALRHTRCNSGERLASANDPYVSFKNGIDAGLPQQ